MFCFKKQNMLFVVLLFYVIKQKDSNKRIQITKQQQKKEI